MKKPKPKVALALYRNLVGGWSTGLKMKKSFKKGAAILVAGMVVFKPFSLSPV